MEPLTDLKAILHSKRANIFYLEKCRVMQKDGRVLYLAEDTKSKQYWNIPIANTTCILLGTGTSITQAAMRMLASAGVLVGFSGGGGTPLIAANEVEWLTPQSEYRPTDCIRIHGSETQLYTLQELKWLGGLTGYCIVSAIQQIPENNVTYRVISRKQANIYPGRFE